MGTWTSTCSNRKIPKPGNIMTCWSQWICTNTWHAQLGPRSSPEHSYDHIVSSIPNRVTYCSVLPCSTISDHDGPYACINIRVNRFQPRFKWLRNEKQSDKQAFNEDLKATPFNLVYSVEDPDEKLEIFNSLLRTCVDKHAPLRKTKITRPPAPWLHKENIRKLQRERDQLRYVAHQTN